MVTFIFPVARSAAVEYLCLLPDRQVKGSFMLFQLTLRLFYKKISNFSCLIRLVLHGVDTAQKRASKDNKWTPWINIFTFGRYKCANVCMCANCCVSYDAGVCPRYPATGHTITAKCWFHTILLVLRCSLPLKYPILPP